MKTSFNRQIHDFEISWPERVARHDLVYLAPPADPLQYGLPIGNGDIGALIWCDDRKLFIAFNKCDLWEDAAFGPFGNWRPEEEEYSTTLRHGCRIVIDFGSPVFDTFYLSDFKARLRMQDGCAVMDLTGPLGSLHAEFFITYEGSVLCGRIHTDLAEEDAIHITFERFGSRTYSHWYRFHVPNPELGLLGTESWIENDFMFLKHTLTTGDFLCAMKVQAEDVVLKRKTSHMLTASIHETVHTLHFYALITSPFEPMEAKAAAGILENAQAQGYDALLAKNETCWKQFWETSFIETDDDYLDNLWHLTLYYSNAGQRGRYPGRFINSLWNWNRDVQNWNFYFHWNQQTVYWGLNATGHHELCDSYLNLRYNGMGPASETAKETFGVENALFVSDVTERRGYNSSSENHNHTPVGEVALDFWRQYQYTGDMDFLKNKALPYILGAARFTASLYVKEEDGFYHAQCGNAYEGGALYYDPITELAMARVLFDVALKALAQADAKDPDMDLWADILEHIAPIRLLDIDPRMASDHQVKLGMFKGYPVSSHKVLALGKLLADRDHPKWIGQYLPQYEPVENKQPLEEMTSLHIMHEAHHEYILPNCRDVYVEQTSFAHPQANISPIYPISMIGIKDKGTPLYDAAVTTALTSRNHQIMGWDPEPIALTRLGLVDAVDQYLRDYPSNWQYFNNGFGHYDDDMYVDGVLPFRRNPLTDEKFERHFWGESFPFRHMGLEPMGILVAVMNERLLQSYDEVLRIVPAYGQKDARFKLHAVGGFEVMSEICEGVPAWVAIKSLRGSKLTLENPWSTAYCNGTCYTESLIEMETTAGTTYFLTPDDCEEFEFEAETPAINQNCKVRPDRNAMLGLERSF